MERSSVAPARRRANPNPRALLGCRPMAGAWDARQYLRFEAERTQPCRDLVARIGLAAPRRIADLGCGPGNSAAVLRSRWPAAEITGVDSSSEMLAKARATDPSVRWEEADLERWTPRAPFDLLFSNAALQWLPDHPGLVSRWLPHVAPRGALAFQVPARPTPPAPWSMAIEEALAGVPGGSAAATDVAAENVLSLAQYYDLLAPSAERVDLWDTEYHHVLEGPADIVEWVRGTALRPVLARLPDDAARTRFLERYGAAIARRYPRRKGGRVIFPFLRRFVVAYLPGS